MMAPCSARSHAAGAPRKVSAGPTVASSATPASVPVSDPRPPETAVPPTTTAAITDSSRPMPALAWTSMNCTAESSAASPVSAPITTNAPAITTGGRTPSRRATSASEPVA